MSKQLVNAPKEIRVVRTAVIKPGLRPVVLSGCRETSFGYEPAQEVFERLMVLSLSGKRISKRLLSEDPKLSREARELVASTASNHKVYGRKDDLEAVCEQLEEYRKRRAAYYASEAIVQGLESGADTDELLNEMEAGLIDARSAKTKDSMFIAGAGEDMGEDTSAGHVVKRILNKKATRRVKTGFAEFDTRTGGFGITNCVAMMAPRGCGKSSMLLAMLIHMYLYERKSVLYIGLEMSEEETYERLISCITGIEHDKIRLDRLTRAERMLIAVAWASFTKHGKTNGIRFVVWSPDILGAEEVSAVVPTMGFDVVALDYLTLMSPPKAASYDKIDALDANARLMKAIAKNKKNPCVTIILVHMTKDWQVKYSRAVENHVDFIWAWMLKRRDKRHKVCRIRQTKARSAKEYDFTIGVNIDCHQWYDIDPENDPYAEDEDFEPHEAGEEDGGDRPRASKPNRQKKPSVGEEVKPPQKFSERYSAEEMEGFDAI